MSAELYVAVLVVESTSTGREPLYREDVVLLRASTAEEAREAAERYGRSSETSYVSATGDTVTDRLLHLVDVSPALNDDFSVPNDLYSRHFRDIAAYRRFDPLLEGEPL